MRKIIVLLLLISLFGGLTLRAQDAACATGIAARLVIGQQGRVATDEGFFLNLRSEPGLGNEPFMRMARGETFDIVAGPRCLDNINWWQIQQFGLVGWIAEAAGTNYLVDPLDIAALPTLPPPTAPQYDLTNDLPPVRLAPNPGPDLQTDFIRWDWAAYMRDSYRPDIPDPLAITLPQTYQGDLPTGPFDLSQVRFVDEVNFSPAQLALLAQNGFVVVPGGMDQFEDAYRWSDNWNPETGHSYWVTTDALLHALHVVFDNMLQFLEKDELYDQVAEVTRRSYQAATQQVDELAGGELADAAQGAAVYYAVALALLDDAAYASEVSPAIKAEADPIIAAVNTAQGRLPLSFLPGYDEDFSQYIVRGHYAGDDVLERYFRGMSWLGRITFLARDDTALQTSLLALRALQTSGTYDLWADVSDVLTFLIGPTDNLGPTEYLPLARDLFGADISPERIADAATLTDFRDAVRALPGPRINNVVRPMGTEADELDDATRGFRLFGQRFTFDSYAMQRLIYPNVGEVGRERPLPSGLDVAAVLGSDIAYDILREQGDTAYANYDGNLAQLREEASQIDTQDWLQNVAGAWLWTLQPLWHRDAAIYPPLLSSQAWLLRDLQAGLGSWAELKHDTLLYTAQPMGGLGGGGERTRTTNGAVEPNPLVFARISLVAYAIEQGLRDRGLTGSSSFDEPGGLGMVVISLRPLAETSAIIAEMARKELWGEPLTEDEEAYLKYNFGSDIWFVRYQAQLALADPPKQSAIISDVASNPDAGTVLQAGTGQVDYIYVIVSTPNGLQINRGTVYTYYEFTGPINNRLTDDDWRAQVRAGTIPPQPDWVNTFKAD